MASTARATAMEYQEPIVLSETVPLPQSGKSAMVVTINRPDRLNAFNTQVCRHLSQIFYDIAEKLRRYEESHFDLGNEDDNGDNGNNGNRDDNDDIAVGDLAAIILTGKGKSFCAGADLSNPENPLSQSSDLPHHLRWNPVHQMSRVGIPIIGALKGHVITGGFELALGCDILLGDSTTTFRDTHVKFGLAPCWGLSQKLQRRISPGRAKILSFSAMPIRASVAYEWGLLDELVHDDHDNADKPNNDAEQKNDAVLARALEIADTIGNNDALMVRRYKRAIVEGGSMDLQKGLQRERELGAAHYLEVVGDGQTFERAKGFIDDGDRPRMQSKL